MGKYLSDAEDSGGNLSVTNVALNRGDTQGLVLRPRISVDRPDSLKLDDVTHSRTSGVAFCNVQHQSLGETMLRACVMLA